ncbi:hypothetical protein [Mycolicibacterium mageritense]|uniref:Uncharacterized protein n=1 Tax=Mycolicibacterium mageritense TaxID=53462 RepID=A0AAI8TYS6_MYCME|nr:hypothetical protein [Mycolicibacterium mageritense]BDY31410.1 hypothetical protein hbim_05362 [Mycolicibacterium mageritense]
MTVELHDQEATEAELLVISWLTPFFTELSGGVDIKRRAGNPLPFGLVREVSNVEDYLQSVSKAIVSVHWLAPTESDCTSVSRNGHRRMSYLLHNPQTDVPLVGGGTGYVEWLDVDHGPIWVDYAKDQIFRKVSRYELALPYNTIQ